ncbi:unnamed protein product [Soboliphyme baturini]|uniref:Uncharacterized protein n=1 Tax=Soboliphyme baturini TaxID=241478 RepID=A0A183IGY9_9BILA|nr:unnamed protein product [Soboliphyme baturini]
MSGVDGTAKKAALFGGIAVCASFCAFLYYYRKICRQLCKRSPDDSLISDICKQAKAEETSEEENCDSEVNESDTEMPVKRGGRQNYRKGNRKGCLSAVDVADSTPTIETRTRCQSQSRPQATATAKVTMTQSPAVSAGFASSAFASASDSVSASAGLLSDCAASSRWSSNFDVDGRRRTVADQSGGGGGGDDDEEFLYAASAVAATDFSWSAEVEQHDRDSAAAAVAVGATATGNEETSDDLSTMMMMTMTMTNEEMNGDHGSVVAPRLQAAHYPLPLVVNHTQTDGDDCSRSFVDTTPAVPLDDMKQKYYTGSPLGAFDVHSEFDRPMEVLVQRCLSLPLARSPFPLSRAKGFIRFYAVSLPEVVAVFIHDSVLTATIPDS